MTSIKIATKDYIRVLVLPIRINRKALELIFVVIMCGVAVVNDDLLVNPFHSLTKQSEDNLSPAPPPVLNPAGRTTEILKTFS